jgi:hypothetical protein
MDGNEVIQRTIEEVPALQIVDYSYAHCSGPHPCHVPEGFKPTIARAQREVDLGRAEASVLAKDLTAKIREDCPESEVIADSEDIFVQPNRERPSWARLIRAIDDDGCKWTIIVRAPDPKCYICHLEKFWDWQVYNSVWGTFHQGVSFEAAAETMRRRTGVSVCPSALRHHILHHWPDLSEDTVEDEEGGKFGILIV